MPPQQAYFEPPAQTVRRRKLLMIAGILAILAVLMLVVSMIFNDPSPRDQIGTVVAGQQELVRVIDETSGSARATGVISLISITRNVLVTDNNELINAGVSVSKSQMTDAALPDAVDELTEASQNNRYDTVMTELINQTLTRNQQLLNEVKPDLSDEDLIAAVDQALVNYETLLQP